MINITVCPSCGSNRIRRVRRDCERKIRSRTYTVPDLRFHECPDCGEKIFDPEAMRKIEAYSPAYRKAKVTK